MNTTPNVSEREALAIAAVYGGVFVYLGLPRQLVQQAGEAAWMAAILAGLTTLAAFWIMARLILSFPEGGLAEAFRQGFGWVGGFSASLLFFLLFVAQDALVTREFIGQIGQTVLPLTPTPVLAVLFLSAAGFGALYGIEGLGRAAWFALPWLAGITALLALLSLEWAHLYNLFPLWGRGAPTVVRTGLLHTTLLGALVLPTIAFQVQPRRAILKAGLRACTLVVTVLVAVQIALGLEFSRTAIIKQPYPIYQLARLVLYGRFFQRMESLFLFVWIIAAIFRISLGIYLAATVFGRALALPNASLLVPAVATTVFGLVTAFPTWTDAYRWDTWILENHAWMVFVGTTLLLGAALAAARRRSGGKRRAV